METFSALLAFCEGNPTVTGGIPAQWPVTRSYDVFFDLRVNKRLSKESKRQLLEMAFALIMTSLQCVLYFTFQKHS